MSRDEIIITFLDRAIKESLDQLPYTTQLFSNPLYDLKKTVTNELDFLLGAFFSQVIVLFSFFCKGANITPNLEESVKYNYVLFSKAQEYKDIIQNKIGN